MSFTSRNDDRDHAEWHRGIRHYGFWCFIIEDEKWLASVAYLQARLRGFLHDGYHRIPHLTVFSVGLLDDQKRDTAARQAALLESALPKKLRLIAEGFDSFPHCPFIKVRCADDDLHRIRSLLSSIAAEDRESAYTPHITLGLYDSETPFSEVFSAVRGFRAGELPPLAFGQLSLCRYDTCSIKGPIEILQRVPVAR